MEKDPDLQQPKNNQFVQIGQVQLNQAGRPKQKVIFYQLTEQMKKELQQKLQQDHTQLSQEEYQKAQSNTQKVWDKFYKFHKCNFFRDRTYLEREMVQITWFRELYQTKQIVSNFSELGCAVGNTLFPLLRDFPCFNYFGCDISAKAISLIQQEMQKHEQLKPRLKVSVCDLVKDQIPYPQTSNLTSLIFVLSAIVPQKHFDVFKKIADWMKPGSFLYFRDYGRYDFGQLNLASKGNRKLKDNFYMKQDGVCVYYFDKEELQLMAEKCGLKKIKVNLHCKLLQNRKTGLKMYRVWLQGRFYKPPIDDFFELKIKQQREREQKQQKQEYQNEHYEDQKKKPEQQQKSQQKIENAQNKQTKQEKVQSNENKQQK